MALPIPPLIFPRARSERKPARLVPPLIFPSAAKATPQRTTTDLTAITPVGKRRQAIDNDARKLHQPYHDASHANGKATLKKNDLSAKNRKSNHRKRKRVGSESTSLEGGASSSSGGSQRDRRSRSPPRANSNDSNAADLADMVKREVQRQMAQTEARMLAEIERRVEEVVRCHGTAESNEGRERRERKTLMKAQRHQQE